MKGDYCDKSLQGIKERDRYNKTFIALCVPVGSIGGGKMGKVPNLAGRYYDLSNPVWEGMPYYPASFPVQIEQASSVKEGGFNVRKITMASHHGTHVDAPRHISNDGMTIDELDLHRLVGEGVVLDLSLKKIGSGIGASDFEKFADLVRMEDIVILYTGCCNHLGESWINSTYTYLEKSGAEWLVQKKVKSVGIDFFSIDKFGDRANPAHNVLLANGIPLIEEISCEAKFLVNKRIYFICLPLKMKLGDGAPARAIAYVLE
jgi:arylformamidase